MLCLRCRKKEATGRYQSHKPSLCDDCRKAERKNHVAFNVPSAPKTEERGFESKKNLIVRKRIDAIKEKLAQDEDDYI